MTIDQTERFRLTGRALEREAADRSTYIEFRELLQKDPLTAGAGMATKFFSNPDGRSSSLLQDEDGSFSVYDYQQPLVAHGLLQTWDHQIHLFPTGSGKTAGTGTMEAMRLFLRPENAVIIAPQEKITRYILNTVQELYRSGSHTLRDALQDSPSDQVWVRRPDGGLSHLFCMTANIKNEGRNLLGLQGITTVLTDEAAEMPNDIRATKVRRITAPKNHRQLRIEITTAHERNFVATESECSQLPRKEECKWWVPHITRRGTAVYKTTWRDGVREGRYDRDYIDERYDELGPDGFDNWYECEFPETSGMYAFPEDLVASMVD